MAYWEALGRSMIVEGTKESADRVANFLSYSGLDAIVASAADESGGAAAPGILYTVTVPSGQAEEAAKLMDIYRQSEDTREQRAASYRENCLSHSPNFIPSEEKFRYSTNSSVTFLCAGIVVVIMALLHFFLVLYQQRGSTVNSCIVELILGFIFIMFAITTHQKVRFLEDRIMEENAFTDEIIRWCTTIYPAEHLDKCIDAANDGRELSGNDRLALRRQLIQTYILREYDIPDTAYLDYLTDTIYKKLYYPNAVTASVRAESTIEQG